MNEVLAITKDQLKESSSNYIRLTINLALLYQDMGKLTEAEAIYLNALKLKEKKQELKEIREVLSQELADYYREEGTMEIEDHKGDIKRLKFSVTLTD